MMQAEGVELDGAAVDAAAASLMQDVQAAEHAAPSALDGSRQSVCTGDSSAALQQPAGAGAATTSAAAASTLSADPLLAIDLADDSWMHAMLASMDSTEDQLPAPAAPLQLQVHPQLLSVQQQQEQQQQFWLGPCPSAGERRTGAKAAVQHRHLCIAFHSAQIH